MTTSPQTPVDALMALVDEAISLAFERDLSRAIKLTVAVEASARALAAIPVLARRPGLPDAEKDRAFALAQHAIYLASPDELDVQIMMTPSDLVRFLGLAAPTPPTAPAQDAQIEVLRFLDGVGGLRGSHFGEKPPTERGNYWWRKDLRAAFPEVDFGIVTKEST